MNLIQLLIGLALGVAIAALAWRARALNRTGAWAAALTGGLIFGLGGLPWAVLLLAFFLSSSALSRAFASRKQHSGEKYAKGSQRDWAQVFANGGLGSVFALALLFLPAQPWLWLTFAGAMAAVTGDTWATEIGVLSSRPPRLITSGELVERGASGGVTWLGILATLGGAALIGLLAGLFTHPVSLPLVLLIVVLAGLGGSLFDSLLGATVQAIYFCPTDQKETEQHPYHSCGSPTHQIRGWRWLNNDLVNFLSSAVGAALAVSLLRLLT